MQGRQVALVAEVLHEGVLRLGGQGGLGVGRDVLKQLSCNLLLTKKCLKIVQIRSMNDNFLVFYLQYEELSFQS